MLNLSAKERLILALDVDNADTALDWVDRLKDYASIFKVGMQLFSAVGPRIISDIKDMGVRVFYDSKFHDIPVTVASASIEVTKLGVYMFNVHALGGERMLRMAVEARDKAAQEMGIDKPILLGVTVLTSMDQRALEDVGVGISLDKQVLRLAQSCREAGLEGVIASPRETQLVRETFGENFVIVTPGVRPTGVSHNDQRRTMTPGEAIKTGSDFLVIGRPILKAEDPIKAIEDILKEIEEALN